MTIKPVPVIKYYLDREDVTRFNHQRYLEDVTRFNHQRYLNKQFRFLTTFGMSTEKAAAIMGMTAAQLEKAVVKMNNDMKQLDNLIAQSGKSMNHCPTSKVCFTKHKAVSCNDVITTIGHTCTQCNVHYPDAASNQGDGTLICWSCRNS